MITLMLRKHDGAFVLDAAGDPASLRTGWTRWRGEIRTPGGVWLVAPTDRRRLGVVAHAEHGPAVRLHPNQSHVPGPGGPARWLIGRHHGELVRDQSRLHIQLPAWPGGPIRVDVTGAWTELGLVALTACFAVMTRRRHRTLTIIAIVGAIGHGPIA
jgi:hypothetical protein